MKQLFFAILFFATTAVHAQTEKFMAAMQSKLEAYKTAQAPQDFLDLSNAFERIAEAEKTEWLAYYYAAHAQVIYGFMIADKTKVDGIANKVEALIDKADSLDHNNSEIFMLKAMVTTLQISINPQVRYMQLAEKYTKSIEQAKKIDITNPRPYIWEAEVIIQTPVNFGGGCTNAQAKIEKAGLLLKDFKPKSIIHPIWGKEQLDALLEKCK